MNETIEVHYKVVVPKEVFDKVLKLAQELGCGYNDAGPLETIRRMFMDSGMSVVEPDIDPLKYEKIV